MANTGDTLRNSNLIRLEPLHHPNVVHHFDLPVSSDAGVAAPLNLFDVARDYIDLEGAIASEASLPVLSGNGVVTWRQGNPEAALIVGLEGCHGAIFLLYQKLSIR